MGNLESFTKLRTHNEDLSGGLPVYLATLTRAFPDWGVIGMS